MDLIDKIKSYLYGRVPLRVVEVDFNTLQQNPASYIDSIVKRSSDAVVIRNFLTAGELNKIKESITALPSDLFDVPHPGAKTFPPACSTGYPDVNARHIFFKNSERYNAQLNTMSGIDIVAKVAGLLQLLNNGKPAELAYNREQNVPYLHGTFRLIEPVGKGMGLTSPHTGFDYALRNIEHSYAPLAAYVDVFKQVSLFTVIDKPGDGGDFTVFNFSRVQYPILQDDTLLKPNRKGAVNLYGADNNHVRFTVNPGDAFLFADFDLWHRVEPFTGNKMRLSYGCWAAYGIADDKLYYWS